MHEETVTGLPLAVVVAITAAVAAAMDTDPGRVRVRSVRPLGTLRPAQGDPWTLAGRAQQHLARLQPLRRGW